MSILEARALSVHYGTGRDRVTAVDGIDLVVPENSTLGLVGESGSGKSTVARAIVGIVPIAGGRLFLNGRDVTTARTRARPQFRRAVQMVFQDPYSSLNPRMTIGSALDDGLTSRGGLTGSQRRAEASRLLDLVGLGLGTLDRYPHEFSGGQRQRVAIARALAVGPRVIIADEVTSALDVSVQATILNLLKDLQESLGLSYLFISHDLSTVRYMSDSIAVMYMHQIVEVAGTDDLFASPRHPYTRSLIASIPQLTTSKSIVPLAGEMPDPRKPPTGCRFHTRCPIGPKAIPARTVCIERDPRQIAEQQEHKAACHFAGVVSLPVGAVARPAPHEVS